MPESNGDVYRELSADMRDGLKSIYRQISTASAAGDPQAIFSEASDQLKEVVRETETAAMDIMEIVEKQLAQTDVTARELEALKGVPGIDGALEKLMQGNEKLARDLTAVLTALSFQDITGQRIKKVMGALESLEENVAELYISSGLVMEAADKNPGKDAKEIRAETEKAMEEYRENRANSQLKGPDKNGVSQAAIDDMLAQLGL